MDEQFDMARFATGMQIASGDLQELTEMLDSLAEMRHASPNEQTVRAVRRDVEKMRRLLDQCREYLGRIECAALSDENK